MCEGGECWGAGGSRWKAQPVTSNVLIRDLDLPVPATDGCRLEVVVDGLPLSGGCQLAVDTTLVCALHCDGSPHIGAADVDGVVLQAARRRKEEPVLNWCPRTRARLVVLVVEVGGQMVRETRSFLAQFAKGRSRVEPRFLRRRAEQAWRMRWGAILFLCSGQGCGHFLVGSEMRPRSGWRHSSQLGGRG